MGKQRIIIIIFLLIASVIFGAYKLGVFESSVASNEVLPAEKEVKAIPVSGLLITSQVLESKITITGTVIANESVEITTELAGKVERIFFEEGRKVKKGDLLLTLNSDELEAQYDKLRYSKKLREDNEFRQRSLLEKEAISQEEYEITLTELNTSIADLKLIEAQLDKTKIRAPFDGIIGLRYISEGAFVNNNTRIAYLANVNPVKLEFSVPGKYSNSIKNGDIVNFTADGMSRSFEGKVYAIDPQIDPNTRTMKLRAISPNDTGNLLPGQFVKVLLTLRSSENAMMVPAEAVVPELTGHKVYRYNNGVAEELKVQIGMRTSTEIELVSGITSGDTLIVSGILQIKDGSPVEITTLR